MTLGKTKIINSFRYVGIVDGCKSEHVDVSDSFRENEVAVSNKDIPKPKLNYVRKTISEDKKNLMREEPVAETVNLFAIPFFKKTHPQSPEFNNKITKNNVCNLGFEEAI